ncbi:cannabinoid receptor 2 isoform X1 [Alosa alosa]|uniref:cannabinoid receptor 2 isoform X1 n=2 Tax=Alosa alosa TaxID=278164 RepID=UPI0020153659|nr:cannabinoid receptor 2 isoform X1 [Alosa alosa]XP_048117292.1 cannabinoid receptor 2 isoform X1 [Alosa alosa]
MATLILLNLHVAMEAELKDTTENSLEVTSSWLNDCSPAAPVGNGSLERYYVLNQTERMAIGSILFLTGPITLLENILVLGIICSSATLRRRPSYLFIASLALADAFASCFFTISFLDFHLFCRHDTPAAYLFKLGGVTMSFTGSVGSLLLTALDRYLCIYQGPIYKVLMTRQRALLGLLALWTVTAVISFLPLMGWRCPTKLSPPCSNLFPYVDHRYLACWVSFILVVLLLIIVSYTLILWKAHQHEASVTGLQGQARLRMDIHLARTLGLILVIMVGCWLPALSFMLADVSVNLRPDQQRAFAFCSTLCLVNSSVNPLLYALRCRDLRGELCRMLGRLCGSWRSRSGADDQYREERSNCSSSVDNEERMGRYTVSVCKEVDQRQHNTAEQ